MAPTDNVLDDVAEKPACGSAVAQFARAFEVFPGNLERFLKQLGKRDRHGLKTNQNRARSMSFPLPRPFPSSAATVWDRKTTSPNTGPPGGSEASQPEKICPANRV